MTRTGRISSRRLIVGFTVTYYTLQARPHAHTQPHTRSISSASRHYSRMHAAWTPQLVQHRLELPPDDIRLHLDFAPPQYIALRKFSSEKPVSHITGACRLAHAGAYRVVGCSAVGGISRVGGGVSRCFPNPFRRFHPNLRVSPDIFS